MTAELAAVLKIVKQIHRNTHAPVRTLTVAVQYGMCRQSMYDYLKRLTQLGELERIGVRKGYIPADK